MLSTPVPAPVPVPVPVVCRYRCRYRWLTRSCSPVWVGKSICAELTRQPSCRFVMIDKVLVWVLYSMHTCTGTGTKMFLGRRAASNYRDGERGLAAPGPARGAGSDASAQRVSVRPALSHVPWQSRIASGATVTRVQQGHVELTQGRSRKPHLAGSLQIR